VLRVKFWYKYETRSVEGPCWVRVGVQRGGRGLGRPLWMDEDAGLELTCRTLQRGRMSLGGCKRQRRVKQFCGAVLGVEELGCVLRCCRRCWGAGVAPPRICPPLPSLSWLLTVFAGGTTSKPESESHPTTVGREKVGMK